MRKTALILLVFALLFGLAGCACRHKWEDATTERPKICSKCGETEGQRITTDQRFTTADTIHIQGTWTQKTAIAARAFQLEGFMDPVDCTVTYEFANDGKMKAYIKFQDREKLLTDLIDATAQANCDALLAQGYTREEADELMRSVYGMTAQELAQKLYENVTGESLEESYAVSGVYYIDAQGLHIGPSWDGEFTCCQYTLENGKLVVDDFVPCEGEPPYELTRTEE